MRTRDLLLIVILPLLSTLLASSKPIHIDEAANVYYARQIAKHPLDPYGFSMFWYEQPQPANHVLTPPGLVYWLAIAVRLFGEQPMLWKLWLLPFVLAFVVSLHGLFRRFAPGLATPLTWLTVLSPAFLPSLNLMPDIPALAWSLSAIVVFLHAEERDSWSLALAAGLLAGLGMQTKYTAFVTPVVLLARAAFVGRWRLGLVACGLTALIFISWEALIAWKYGESHFLYQLREDGSGLLEKRSVARALVPILGYVAPVIGVLGLAAVGLPRRFLVLTGTVIVLGVGLAAWGAESMLFGEEIVWARPIFGTLGVLVCGVACWLAWVCWKSDMESRFLVLWLGLELAGYFALSPFPAVRRLLALVLVLTLIAGRVLSRRVGRVFEAHHASGGPRRLDPPYGIIALGIILGLLYFIVDLFDARAQMLGVQAVVREIDSGRVWYVGHWGFQYYAESAGMVPLVPEASHLQPGDWLVLPGEPINRQELVVSDEHTSFAFEVEVADHVPWRVVMGYYGGSEPLRHCDQPRLRVEIRRIMLPWTPRALR